ASNRPALPLRMHDGRGCSAGRSLMHTNTHLRGIPMRATAASCATMDGSRRDPGRPGGRGSDHRSLVARVDRRPATATAQERLVPTDKAAVIRSVLAESRRIAVVGASENPGRPSHGVVRRLLDIGYAIVPVNPNA